MLEYCLSSVGNINSLFVFVVTWVYNRPKQDYAKSPTPAQPKEQGH